MARLLQTTFMRALLLLTLSCWSLYGPAQAQTISTFAGTGTAGNNGAGGGAATSANIHSPFQSCTDAAGNFYFVDYNNDQVRKVNTSGVISLFAGTGSSSNTGDGAAATAATFISIISVCPDAAGNIYICDQGANRVRKVNSSGVISNFAGSASGTGSFSGDGAAATAATLRFPQGICSDGSNNIYICDANNYRIRKVTASSGNISTICGSGTNGNTGNGGLATAATMSYPYGIAVNAAGTTVWFADETYNVVRKFTVGGNIVAYAGSGSPTTSGDGGPATAAGVAGAAGIAFDAQGNGYIAAPNENRIRRVDAVTGNISTFSGNGTASSTGDGGAASAATINTPLALSISPSNALYISEFSGNRIRKVQLQQLNGLSFDGVDDNVDCGTTAGNFGTSDFTAELWFKTSTTGPPAFISKRSVCGQTNFWNVGIAGGQVYFEVDQDASATNYKDVTTVATYNDGAWHHAACTRSGAALKIFIDGVLAASGSGSGVANLNNAASLKLGFSPCGYFNGSLDEVRLWNRALCQAEIQNNMNGELPRPTAQTGLVAYYTFDQGIVSGTNTGLTTLSDSSGNGNSGTLNTFALTGNTSNYVAGTTAIAGYDAQYAPLTPSATTENLTKTISGTTATAVNGCGALLSITPTGGTALSGSVVFKITEDGSVNSINAQPYVQRHYDIEPATNAMTATATITLYYTQAEFTTFNASRGTFPSLPVDVTDAAGYKANLRISQYHGVPTGGNAPGNYPATWGGSGPAHRLITPTSVTYNSTASRWEVTFPVTGFSSFFASTNSNGPLPLKLLSFGAQKTGGKANRLSWATATEDAGTTFDITRSGNGSSFEQIGSTAGKGGNSSYSFDDVQPLGGVNYYRLKIGEADGTTSYSNVAIVGSGANGGGVTVTPVPAHNSVTITNTDAGLNGGSCAITDMQGREVLRFVMNAVNTIDISGLASGIYSLRLPSGEVVRMVKQ